MTDPYRDPTASDTVSADAGALVDEPLPGDTGSPAGETAEPATGKDREWLSQLQSIIDDVATQAAPIARQVASKAAELAAVAAEKAGPFAQRAAEVTADASAKFAEKAHEAAAGLRRDAEAAQAGTESQAARDPLWSSDPASTAERDEPTPTTPA